MYRGIVREVFIPGITNGDGSYSGIMEAKYLGFRIEILEYYLGNYESTDNVFVNKVVTVIEPDIKETANIRKGARVLVGGPYFMDACECMMDISATETHMLLNLSTRPYIKLDKSST